MVVQERADLRWQERAVVNQLRRADQEEELVVQERAVVNLLKRADQEEELVVQERAVVNLLKKADQEEELVVQERAIVNQLRRADQEEELVVQERAVVNLLKRADQEEELVVPRRRVSRGFFRYNMDAPNIITDEGIIRYATVTPALLKREAERQYKRSAAGSMRAGWRPSGSGPVYSPPPPPRLVSPAEARWMRENQE